MMWLIRWNKLLTADISLAGQSISADGEITGNHGDYDYWVVKLASWISPLKSAEVSTNETPITVKPNPTTGQIRITGY